MCYGYTDHGYTMLTRCASHWLLNETLRGAWNFSGYVSSDSGAVVG